MGRNLYYEDEILEEKFNGFMFKRLLSYAAEYKRDYVKAAVLLSGAALLSLVPTAINMEIINEVLPDNGAVPDNAGSKAVILLSLWITLSLGSVIADYFSSKTATTIGNNIVCRLREDLFAKLMELSFDYYDSRPTGKILVRITNYTDEIANFFINNLLRVIDRVLVMVITVICICFVEIRMAVMGIVVSIPLAMLLWAVAKALHRYSRIDRNKMSNRTAFVAEDINGLEVIKAWGFTYKTVAFVWVKQNKKKESLFWGMGYWTRSNAELCILATKGAPKRVDAGVHQVVMSHIEEHSRKPAEVHQRINRLMGSVPKIELFARRKTDGFDVWGNEVECDIELTGGK